MAVHSLVLRAEGWSTGHVHELNSLHTPCMYVEKVYMGYYIVNIRSEWPFIIIIIVNMYIYNYMGIC